MGRFVCAALLALLLALGGAANAADQPAARPEIGKPVQEAQALVRQKKFAEALARLRAADAVGNKSPYEVYIIEETRAAAALESGDLATGAKALEAVLATGILSPADRLQRTATLISVEFQLKDYAKTVALADRYYRDGGADPAPRQAMAQAYYNEGDYADAEKTLRALADADAKTGKAPDENLLLALAGSSFKANDRPGYVDALERLVAAHPKPEYWVNLTQAVAQKPGFDRQRLALDLARVEVAVGAMTTPQQYTDAAERALADGFPGDAKTFLDRGYQAGVLGKGAGTDRQKRLADMARRQADDDVKSLPQQAKEAASAPSGLALEKLGEAYLSYGRYDDAVAALRNAIAKGGLAHPEDAKLHLGVAQLKAGQAAQARQTLQGLGGGDGVADLGRLWLVSARAR